MLGHMTQTLELNLMSNTFFVLNTNAISLILQYGILEKRVTFIPLNLVSFLGNINIIAFETLIGLLLCLEGIRQKL